MARLVPGFGWLTLAASLVAGPALAADYYVDPSAGSSDGTGEADDPWSTLEAAIASGAFEATVQGGDRVLLDSGYHGELVLDGLDFEPPVVIEADADASPQLARVRIGSSGVVLRGLSISPSHAPSYESGTIVDVEGSDVTIEDCDIFSEDDATGWSADDWISRASSGVGVGGSDVTIANNHIRNVRFGISADGVRAHIVGNTIDGFSADGLRGLGDYELFEYNLVKNVYVDGDLDDNHDDGFQSWSVGDDGVGTGEVIGVVLRGNVILNYEDPDQPFRATLQGIGCFDGTFVDWVIENNVVITDHWHGITLLGARNSRIVNNTVIDVNDESPGPPWISIDAHKDGTPPEGCLVRNNLATDYANADTGVTEDHNFVIEDPFALFVDPDHHDLHLLPTAEVIDQGTVEQAPETDADGIARPQGDGVDLGAFEWHEANVQPVDSGVAAPGVDGSVDADPATEAPSDAGAGAADDDAPAGSGGKRSAPDTKPGAAPEVVGDAGSEGVAPDEDGGCGCELPGRRSPGGAWLVLLSVLAVALRRARGDDL